MRCAKRFTSALDVFLTARRPASTSAKLAWATVDTKPASFWPDCGAYSSRDWLRDCDEAAFWSLLFSHPTCKPRPRARAAATRIEVRTLMVHLLPRAFRSSSRPPV